MLDHLRRGALTAGRIGRANIGRPARPVKINLALTYWCQYRCQTCNIWQRRPADELSTSEILAFIHENPSVSWLDVTGGEIFLRDDIADILAALAGSWRDLFILHFPTNGFLTDRIVRVAEYLAGTRIPHVVITVSVDGAEALNDEVRGIRGGFQRQVATLRALRRIPRVRTVVGMTLSRLNIGRYDETLAAIRSACPDISANDVHLNIAQVSEHYYGNEESTGLLAPRDEARRELQGYRSKRAPDHSPAGWLEARFLDRLDAFLETGTSPMPCHALRSSCFIDPWGTVFPCISYSRPMGRLRDTGMRLEPIWAAAATRETQREIWRGQCPQCWTACEAYPSILGNALSPWRRA
ncbi:MAG: radical SAM protein [Vicinamibacterales bacterium]